MLKIIQVGHNDASDRYIRNKIKAVEEAGMHAEVVNLPEDCVAGNLYDAVIREDTNPETSAIIVQLPLPKHIPKELVCGWISPHKDIDGLNPISPYKPLTPCAIMRWLDEQNIELPGKNVVIFGRSELVGKPLANMMIDAGATVTVLNSKSRPSAALHACEYADIIVTAVGKVDTIDWDYVAYHHNLIVIDVGINRGSDGKLCGDVSKLAKTIIEQNGGICTPVPGGVGKWTVRELVLRLKEMEKQNERE